MFTSRVAVLTQSFPSLLQMYMNSSHISISRLPCDAHWPVLTMWWQPRTIVGWLWSD